MKRIYLAIVVALLAGPAWAGIKGSPHDLASSNSTTGVLKSDTVDQTCVFCHTPHKADTTKFGPLWNRNDAYDFTGAALYNTSNSLSAAAKAVDIAAVNATDAPLCMSCHDGTLGAALANLPTGYAAGAFDANDDFTRLMSASAELMDVANGLSNDHPIAFNYETAQGTDAGLHPIGDAISSGIKFFGNTAPDTGKMMWCSSCHNVHEYGTGGVTPDGKIPFLIVSNSQSDLCLACHKK